jgi:hypothetical protein
MIPCLNRNVEKDPEAIEKLVVRVLPRPSARSVWVGDVVAFNSPLGKPSESQVMVRRVAAVEGMEMVSEEEGDSGEDDFQIPEVRTSEVGMTTTTRLVACYPQQNFSPELPLNHIEWMLLLTALLLGPLLGPCRQSQCKAPSSH